jgi:hypothetical protein
MPLNDEDLKSIITWPQCQPGELGILPDGTAVSLEIIALFWCIHGNIPTQTPPIHKLAEFFADTTPSTGVELERIGLDHPVIIVKTASGQWFGLDGRKRIDCAQELGLDRFPALQLAEADVRRIGRITPEFLEGEEYTPAEKAAYRLALLASKVTQKRVETRPWYQELARTMELAFGAGSLDGTGKGRPYRLARSHLRTTEKEGKAGRKNIPDIDYLEAGMGRVLAAIRKTLKASGQVFSIERIVDALENGRIRTYADAPEQFRLTVNLPHIRTLYKLVRNAKHDDVCLADRPKAMVIENLPETWTSGPLIGMVLLLRDLGVLHRRIQEFDQKFNELKRDAERGAIVDPEPYDGMMFDRSTQSKFQPMPECLPIPGLIDAMTIAKETGVFASDYYADWIFTRPMLEVGFILNEARRNRDPKINLGTAVSYLQYRARSAIGRNGPLDAIWRLAVRGHAEMADCLDLVALASVRAGVPIAFPMALPEANPR